MKRYKMNITYVAHQFTGLVSILELQEMEPGLKILSPDDSTITVLGVPGKDGSYQTLNPGDWLVQTDDGKEKISNVLSDEEFKSYMVEIE